PEDRCDALFPESESAAAASAFPWCESGQAKCAFAAAVARAGAWIPDSRGTACPAYRAPGDSEEKSALRNCSSRFRSPALRQRNNPDSEIRKRFHFLS